MAAITRPKGNPKFSVGQTVVFKIEGQIVIAPVKSITWNKEPSGGLAEWKYFLDTPAFGQGTTVPQSTLSKLQNL